MRRREPGPAAGPGELEALDPLTGESLANAPSTTASANASSFEGRAPVERARRLRLAARLLVGGALACAVTAGYFGVTIVQLRGIERTWRHAMAVDEARADADRRVRSLLEAMGNAGETQASALEPLGEEAAASLESAEEALRERRIIDRKVSALRDQMLGALRFRRFQMSPERSLLGDTPLDDVEVALATQLDRWSLERTRVAVRPLSALGAQVERLARFADEPTGTLLFAVRARTELLTVDVDASAVRSRRVPQPIHGLFPAEDGAVAVADGIDLVVYPPDPDDEPLLRVPASWAVAAGDGTNDLWILADDDAELRGTVRRLRPAAGERPQEAIALPPKRHLAGAARGVLVLADVDTGGLELWFLDSRQVTKVLSTSPSRFLDGEGDVIAWQGPLEFGNPDSDGFVHRMSVSAERRDLIGLPRTDAASGVLTAAGDLYIAAGPLAGEFAAVTVAPADSPALFGVRGPRVAVDHAAIALSPGGGHVFWRTPDGSLAILPMRDPSTARRLRTGLEGVERLVAVGR